MQASKYLSRKIRMYVCTYTYNTGEVKFSIPKMQRNATNASILQRKKKKKKKKGEKNQKFALSIYYC